MAWPPTSGVSTGFNIDTPTTGVSSVRWGTEGLKTIEWIKAHAGDVQLPVLFVHGEKDPLLAAEGARRFYEQISYPDKTLRIYPDSRHECHNDLDCGRVVADVAEWMNGHLGEA